MTRRERYLLARDIGVLVVAILTLGVAVVFAVWG